MNHKLSELLIFLYSSSIEGHIGVTPAEDRLVSTQTRRFIRWLLAQSKYKCAGVCVDSYAVGLKD